MKIYNYCDAQNHNDVNFRALKIKSQKKWPEYALDSMLNNKEMQKLIDIYESQNVDIIAKRHTINPKADNILITLQDSYGTFMGCYSSDTFKYDNFNAHSAQRIIRTTPLNKTVNENVFEKFFKMVKKILTFNIS